MIKPALRIQVRLESSRIPQAIDFFSYKSLFLESLIVTKLGMEGSTVVMCSRAAVRRSVYVRVMMPSYVLVGKG